MKNSFTAANEFPYKIFRDLGLLVSIFDGEKILPRHVQLSPTNKCNLKCSFCSCQSRDQKQEWTFDDVQKITKILKEVWTKGVTITGGGEPFLFKHIDELIISLRNIGVSVGIVSNGTIPCNELIIPLITWIRFSFSDDRVIDNKFLDNIRKWIGKGVDLAFSYVVTADVNFSNIKQIVEFANNNKFTHIRLVSDILDPQTSKNILNVKDFLRRDCDIDDSLVIYQPRGSYTKGIQRCLISLLKPMIYSDGHIYPCCGVQYALIDDTKRMPERMRMGYYTKLPQIIEKQKCFDGSICNVCYYEKYNVVLDSLLEKMKHLDFI